MDYDAILKAYMGQNDADANTVGDYLRRLLEELFAEGECFSGKRPFGNSGWEYEIYKTFIQCGVVKGNLDEDGFIEDVNEPEAKKLVFKLIDHVFKEYSEAAQ